MSTWGKASISSAPKGSILEDPAKADTGIDYTGKEVSEPVITYPTCRVRMRSLFWAHLACVAALLAHFACVAALLAHYLAHLDILAALLSLYFSSN